MEKNIAIRIGQNIAEARKLSKRTQADVAEKLGIDTGSLSRMERGMAIPNAIRLMELAEIFECGTDELIMESSQRATDKLRQIGKVMHLLSGKDQLMLLEMTLTLANRLANTTETS